MVSLNGQLLGNTSNQFLRYVFSVPAGTLKPSHNLLTVTFGAQLKIPTGGRFTCVPRPFVEVYLSSAHSATVAPSLTGTFCMQQHTNAVACAGSTVFALTWAPTNQSHAPTQHPSYPVRNRNSNSCNSIQIPSTVTSLDTPARSTGRRQCSPRTRQFRAEQPSASASGSRFICCHCQLTDQTVPTEAPPSRSLYPTHFTLAGTPRVFCPIQHIRALKCGLALVYTLRQAAQALCPLSARGRGP